MNSNTKLEIAIEIMAAKIAKTSRENNEKAKEELKILMEERNKMYREDKDIIYKIINVYGKEIK
jgi:shikimate kinase